jgi:dipeptidyl-peptidase-4
MKARPALLAACLLVTAAHADHGNLADFNELTGRWFGMAKTKVLNDSLDLHWAPDDSAVFYQLESADEKRPMKLDPATGKAEAAADSDPKPEARPEERRGNRRRGDRPGPRGSWKSPDERWDVALREGELILRDTKEGTERALAKADAAGAFTGQPLWAPDSSRFAMWKENDVAERIVHYIESSPKDQLQPKHFTNSYPKPGDEIDTRAPWVFFTGRDEPIAADPKLLENPFECRELAWRGDSKRLTFEFVERGFGKHNIIEIDSATREQRVLVREESNTFVFVYGNSFRRDLNDGDEILWMSERDGWKHLYLLDGRDGSTKRQLTKGEWVVREVVNVDEENREVLLKISGCYKDRDPYYIHYARVSIDSGKLIPLTKSDGTHDRFERSPGGKYYTCRWSRVNHAPVTELRRWADGELVATLAEADDSKLRATKWPIPEPFVSKDRDGKFDIHGVVCLPPDFDPAKKYPVIENIYAGPQDSFVPKAWNPWMQPKHEIAVHGFIVVQIDGKGTANRSKEFHHFCYKNLKDAGFPDRIAWLKEAAKKWPQMDLERVGVFGGSAGGQNALGALLFHGDFYKAAAADCGCHDNRMDKIWWNEQWMDWPIGPEYADNSNVTHAKNLKGALLLTVGEVDTNVDPSSTYQVINALIAADKDFEFLPMTGRNHGSGEERYAQRRRVDFFRAHLGGPR